MDIRQQPYQLELTDKMTLKNKKHKTIRQLVSLLKVADQSVKSELHGII